MIKLNAVVLGLLTVLLTISVFPQTPKTTNKKTTTIDKDGKTVEKEESTFSIEKGFKNSRKKSVSSYITEVSANMGAEKYDEAVILGNDCVRFYPKEARCFYIRGKARALNNLPQATRTDFETAWRLNKTYKEEWRKNLTIFSVPLFVEAVLGTDKTDKNKLATSIEVHSFLLKIAPDAVIYEQRGLLYEVQKNLSAAMADYNSAISLNPQSKTHYGYRANIHCLKGDTAAAAADEAKTVELGGKIHKTCQDTVKQNPVKKP